MTDRCWRCNTIVNKDNLANIGMVSGMFIHTCINCSPEPICQALGDAIKKGFRNQQVGLQKFAELMGITNIRASAILRGRVVPNDDEMTKIAKNLGVSEESLRRLIEV